MHSLSFGADLLVEGAVRSEERRLQRRNLIEGRRSDGCGGRRGGSVLGCHRSTDGPELRGRSRQLFRHCLEE
ncbi:Uncharacterised protein [Mycobacterium tuberculosis]|uniref:Uncharacterized protein n=1 Tax=Mycobacterium tuberculosis TaxID=1773 RepID=A0A916LH36_MYCTX|nr:Uncharacterised protein [Mycobacterium tuberculosis]CPB72355.1 Uncharacterised protein [Mycobacterium tuberculosis]